MSWIRAKIASNYFKLVFPLFRVNKEGSSPVFNVNSKVNFETELISGKSCVHTVIMIKSSTTRNINNFRRKVARISKTSSLNSLNELNFLNWRRNFPGNSIITARVYQGKLFSNQDEMDVCPKRHAYIIRRVHWWRRSGIGFARRFWNHIKKILFPW